MCFEELVCLVEETAAFSGGLRDPGGGEKKTNSTPAGAVMRL